MGGASRGRVGYQRGLPRLVYLVFSVHIHHLVTWQFDWGQTEKGSEPNPKFQSVIEKKSLK